MTDQPFQPISDHDLLIRLDVKLQQVSDDIKALNQGISLRLGNPERQVTHNTQWIHDFKLTWKTLIAMASTCGAVVGFVVSLVVQLLGLNIK